MVVKNNAFEVRQSWVQIIALPFNSHVAMDKLRDQHKPRLPHRHYGDNSSYLTEVFHEIIYTERLA